MNAAPPPPMSRPVALDEKGYAWLPHPSGAPAVIGCYVHAGLRMGWTPVPELGGLLVSQFGGPAAEEGFEEEGVLAFFTVAGLRAYASDLLAIADATEAG